MRRNPFPRLLWSCLVVAIMLPSGLIFDAPSFGAQPPPAAPIGLTLTPDNTESEVSWTAPPSDLNRLSASDADGDTITWSLEDKQSDTVNDKDSYLETISKPLRDERIETNPAGLR